MLRAHILILGGEKKRKKRKKKKLIDLLEGLSLLPSDLLPMVVGYNHQFSDKGEPPSEKTPAAQPKENLDPTSSLPPDLPNWKINDVLKLFTRLKLSDPVIEECKSRKIDGQKLMTLTKQDLIDMGITNHPGYYLRKIEEQVYSWKRKVELKKKAQKQTDHVWDRVYLTSPTTQHQKIPENVPKNSDKKNKEYPTVNNYLSNLEHKTLGERFNDLIEIAKKNSIDS